MTMSWLGVTIGRPLAGDKTLLADSISPRASACASADSGRWTAIWSPSKSALNASHTSGWIWIALPSTSTGSNAWMPRRWSVGARLSSTGGSAMTSSRTSPTSGVIESTSFLGALLPLGHVGQRLERAVSRAGHRAAASAIVQEGVDRFLQHALLVVDDDL